MIATGLVFVLGALVATLIALLFVPLLWRNAQRLARRDMAATMPATMNEIRAEVDRVRAEAAVAVRRNELLARKAQERAARERAEVGRLTVTQADTLYLRDQHEAESNSLRGQLSTAQDRIARLEEDNSGLRSESEALRASLRSLEDTILSAAPSSDGETNDHLPAPPKGDEDPAAQTRFDVASAALSSILREAEAKRTERDADGGPAVSEAIIRPSATASPVSSIAEQEADAIAELRQLADPSRRPADAAERERENALVRDRISSLAQRILQVTAPSPAPGSVDTETGAAAGQTSAETVDRGSVTAERQSAPTAGQDAKRRRGGGRSRRRSQH